MLTFDVRIYTIDKRPDRPKPFRLRWKVGTTSHSKSYTINAQADGRRSELMAALRRGEQFDEESGLPVSEWRAQQQPTWFEHAKAHAAMKWPRSSANSRAARADALATITPALVVDRQGMPEPEVLRTALSCWAFNASGRLPEPPQEIAAALAWISEKSVRMPELENSETVRRALDALSLKLDGKPAADTTIRRKRMVFNNALRFAVERRLLPANPLQFVDWAPPETDDEIDWRFVPNVRQAKALLTAVREASPRGRHLAAFYACIYYAGMRPAEVMALRRADCTLPGKGWGVLLLAGSSPRAGSTWTDDGQSHDERGLKRRARKATRDVPIPPELVRFLREHLAEFKTGPDGRLFRASQGGVVLSKEYAAVWKKARDKGLTDEQAATPLAAVPYSLRHACVSGWLTAGVDPTEVARRAGHSVAVLYRFYAKILDGRRDQANGQIERFLDADDGSE